LSTVSFCAPVGESACHHFIKTPLINTDGLAAWAEIFITLVPHPGELLGDSLLMAA
jgi:hypothetical protein